MVKNILKIISKKVLYYKEKYIPNKKYPVIIDSYGTVIHGMILPAKDEFGDVVFTKKEIQINDNRFLIEPGKFSMSSIVTGFIYYFDNIEFLAHHDVVEIKKGTSKQFLDEFFKEDKKHG